MARKPKDVQSPPPLIETRASEPPSTEARPVGIQDIAKALGISIGTVDRAIHSRGGINPITKERVLKMALTLGYQPNLAARYLKAPRQVRVAIVGRPQLVNLRGLFLAALVRVGEIPCALGFNQDGKASF